MTELVVAGGFADGGTEWESTLRIGSANVCTLTKVSAMSMH